MDSLAFILWSVVPRRPDKHPQSAQELGEGARRRRRGRNFNPKPRSEPLDLAWNYSRQCFVIVLSFLTQANILRKVRRESKC